MCHTRTIVGAIVGLAMLCPAMSAWAAMTADALVETGAALFKRAAYREALVFLEAAAEQDPRAAPHVLYALARCHEELRQWSEAIRYYEAVLNLPVPSEARAMSDLALRVLRVRMQEGRERRPSPSLAGGAAPVRPLEDLRRDAPPVGQAGATPTPGTGSGDAAASDGAGSPVLRVSAGQANLTLRPSDGAAPTAAVIVASPPTGARAGRRVQPWTWATLGAGSAAVLAGGVSFGFGQRDHNRLISINIGHDSAGGEPLQRARALERQGDDKKTAGYVLWGVGGALLITSVILLVMDLVDAAEAPAQPGTAEAGLGVAASF